MIEADFQSLSTTNHSNFKKKKKGGSKWHKPSEKSI